MKKHSLISSIIRQNRKDLKLSQEELALRSGVGLRFVRDLEQGKPSIRMDKLSIVLAYFGLEVSAVKMKPQDE